MVEISDEQFEILIGEALESLPGIHARRIENVAILSRDVPSEEQRRELQLRDHETLFGLYEGTPLAMRQGQQPLFPDRITLFKLPLAQASSTLAELKEEVRHTLWHEIGHYYGLDHERIAELE